jgi:hypothetical protein
MGSSLYHSEAPRSVFEDPTSVTPRFASGGTMFSLFASPWWHEVLGKLWDYIVRSKGIGRVRSNLNRKPTDSAKIRQLREQIVDSGEVCYGACFGSVTVKGRDDKWVPHVGDPDRCERPEEMLTAGTPGQHAGGGSWAARGKWTVLVSCRGVRPRLVGQFPFLFSFDLIFLIPISNQVLNFKFWIKFKYNSILKQFKCTDKTSIWIREYNFSYLFIIFCFSKCSQHTSQKITFRKIISNLYHSIKDYFTHPP